MENENIENESGHDNNNDPIHNLKEEFSRKLGNQESKLDQVTSQMQELLTALNTTYANNNTNLYSADSSGNQNNDSGDDLNDLIYTNPAKFVEIITNKTKAETENAILSKLNRQDQEARIINQLAMEYPELNDDKSDLSLEAVKIFSTYSKEEKADPRSYKLAVQEAALNQGIRPSSKRRNADDFTASSRNGGKPNKSSKIPDETLQFAQLMGININDKKTIDSIKKYSDRNFKSWGN